MTALQKISLPNLMRISCLPHPRFVHDTQSPKFYHDYSLYCRYLIFWSKLLTSIISRISKYLDLKTAFFKLLSALISYTTPQDFVVHQLQSTTTLHISVLR